MDYLKCFNTQGNFVPMLYYTVKYGCIPNRYELSLKEEDYIDVEALAKIICELFGNDIEIIKSIYENEVPTSAINDDDLEDEDEIYKNGEFITTTLKVTDSYSRYWEFYKSGISVFYFGSLDQVRDTVKELRVKIPKLENKPKAAEVGLIAYDNGYYTINSKIAKTDINLAENYNDDFLPVFEDIKKFLDSRKSGIVVMNGQKGTGKTSIIRFIASQFPRKYRIVTNAIAARLAEPDFMSYLLSNKDSVFILEDCEQILMDRSENTFGGAIANILNMSDGLMSDIFNIKFICTFNADITKIDSALLRKGRCYANYEFKPLVKEKVKVLSDKYNLGIKEYKDMTLAEIYNYDATDYDAESKPKRKIGF